MVPSPEQQNEFQKRHPDSAPGIYWINSDLCLDCNLCRELAPTVFRRDDRMGISYVYKQPATPQELAQAREAVEGCCVETIFANGHLFNWE